MKTVDLNFMTEAQSVYKYILATIYSELENHGPFEMGNAEKMDIYRRISSLSSNIGDLEKYRMEAKGYKDDDYYNQYSDQETLTSIKNLLSFKKNFEELINTKFPSFKEIELINFNLNDSSQLIKDMNYLNIKYTLK